MMFVLFSSTQRLQPVGQEILTLATAPELIPLVVLAFLLVMFSESLIVFSSFFFWSFYCLSFFDLRFWLHV
jgi:hypothetical protein